MLAAAWFTRRLESICDRLELSAGVLSILGALGANIPNYVASIDAIARGSTEVGLGIIIGSNIYNIAIILGLAAFAVPGRKLLSFSSEETSQVKYVGGYALAMMLATLLVVWLLPQHVLVPSFVNSPLATWFLLAGSLLALGIFLSFAWHILHRPHPAHASQAQPASGTAGKTSSLTRLIIEAVLALAVALGGVVIMVQTGQDLTTRLHMAPVLAGLLVLAVATSLPNTVVALSLVRTGRAAACVEEVFSSNSVNAALGIALPLLFWHQGTDDTLLLVLDVPLMVLLLLWAFLCARRGKFGYAAGAGLLVSYVLWVGLHLFL